MPLAPPRCCPCGGLKRNGVCDRCGRPKDTRPNSNQRGYDQPWRDFASDYLAQPDHCLCVCCQAQGVCNGTRGRTGLRADHIIPLDMAPHLKYELSNIQPLCLDCDLKYKQPIEKRASNGEQVRIEWEAKLEELMSDKAYRGGA